MPDLNLRWLDPQPADPGPLDALDLHPLAARILAQRGFRSPAQARAFLDPNHYTPTPPAELPDLTLGVERLTQAVRRGEHVLVWGDFDVDGQTSTALLVQTLRAVGASVSSYIPLRARESHGVKPERLQALYRERQPDLLLTCDTGITAHAALAWAAAQGLDVIVTDHHDLGDSLPPALAVINPKRLPESHPLTSLPGVGVAWMLAAALLERFPQADLQAETLLDLAALGIVADVAELRGEARYLLQRGLPQLRRSQRLGLQTLYRAADVLPDRLNEEHIGFRLAPRLNAIGRLGDANPVVELLTTDNPARAQAIVQHLESLNAQRQMLTRQVMEGALAQLTRQPELAELPVLVLAHPDWPAGVLGIAAGQLAERFRKPVILLQTAKDGPARGSARSRPGVHITRAIAAQRDLLLGFGGHPQAAGLSLPRENLPEFRRRLARTVAAMLAEARLEPTLQVDAWLPWNEPSLELAQALEVLAPFGNGHPAPVLATRNLRLVHAAAIGRTREHLRLTVRDQEGHTQTVLWWRGAGEPIPQAFDLAYTLRVGDYRGQPQLNLTLTALRESRRPQIAVQSAAPQREILDWRDQPLTPADLLRRLDAWPEALVWAEGPARAAVRGSGREALRPAQTLVIWTPPPSRRLLLDALERVQPQRVILADDQTPPQEVKDLLRQVAGLVKYARRQYPEGLPLETLAVASAQRVLTVELALGWWAARGQFSFTLEGERVRFAPPHAPNPALQAETAAALKTLVQETNAWRAHYRRLPAQTLLT